MSLKANKLTCWCRRLESEESPVFLHSWDGSGFVCLFDWWLVFVCLTDDWCLFVWLVTGVCLFDRWLVSVCLTGDLCSVVALVTGVWLTGYWGLFDWLVTSICVFDWWLVFVCLTGDWCLFVCVSGVCLFALLVTAVCLFDWLLVFVCLFHWWLVFVCFTVDLLEDCLVVIGWLRSVDWSVQGLQLVNNGVDLHGNACLGPIATTPKKHFSRITTFCHCWVMSKLKQIFVEVFP